MRKYLALSRVRNVRFMILVDTGISSVTNVVTLLLAARLLPGADLAVFSTFQLIVMTAVGIQRAAVLYPSFTAQRQHGRTYIPTQWCATISIPFATVVSLTCCVLLGLAPLSLVGLVIFCASLAYLSQDVLRYHFYTLDSPGRATASDTIGFAALTILTIVYISSGRGSDWSSFAIIWAASGLAVVVVALALALALRRRTSSQTSIRAQLQWTIRYGKWSALDNILSGIASVGPVVFSTIVLTSDVAGIYRVFQTVQGPLNVLSSSLVTLIGLSAWSITGEPALRAFRIRVLRMSVGMGVLALAYMVVAVFVVGALTNVVQPSSAHAIVLVAISGVLNALTVPVAAGSAILGKQRIGVMLRLVIVLAALLLVGASARTTLVPWNDPVGVLMIFASVLGLLGWAVGFFLAIRVEVENARSAVATVPGA